MKATINMKATNNEKAITNVLRDMAVDGLYFLIAIALTLGGLWSLLQINASFFTLIIFGLLMGPSLFSTVFYLIRNINQAKHTLIA